MIRYTIDDGLILLSLSRDRGIQPMNHQIPVMKVLIGSTVSCGLAHFHPGGGCPFRFRYKTYHRQKSQVAFSKNLLILLQELKKQLCGNGLFHDIDIEQRTALNTVEIFYYASLLHLVFVKIHPFQDGNGRTARLIE